MKLSKSKQRQLDSAYDILIQVCLYDMPVKKMECLLADDVMNFGAGKKEITKTKATFLKQIKNQKKLAAGLKMDFKFNPVLRKVTNKGNGAIYTDDILNTVWVNGVENKLKFRLSFIFEYSHHKWLLVHSHTSTPDHQRSNDEVWPVGELKRRTAILEKVDEKIAELEIKNHELVIEAALERVRTVALGMKKSDELINVCTVMYKELSALGFTNIRNAQIAIKNDKRQSYTVCEYSDHISVILGEAPYNSSPIVQALYDELEKSTDALYQKEFSGKEFEDWRKWRQGVTKENDARLEQAHSMCFHLFSIGIGHLGISTFNAITKEQLDILKRFRNVFELSYRRYMDVAQAEAQARESQIQSALERVRARTMAMQRSHDLAETVSIVFRQLLDLGIRSTQMRTCAIVTLKPDEPLGECWITSPDGKIIAQSFMVPYDETSAYKTIYAAWKQGEKFLVVHLSGDALMEHLNFLKKYAKIPTQQFQVVPDQPAETYTHALFFSQGYLLIISNEPLPDYHDIFKRFGAVFEQTYTRFLDLRKAETQAREAQIEASLERVRSKAMAMQKSEDLAKAVAIVFEELDKLNMGTLRCGISIINKEKRSTNVWSTTKWEKGTPVQVTGDESMDIHPLLQGAFNAWQNGDDYSYLLQGEDLNRFYKALTATNFKLPDPQPNEMRLEESQQYLYVAHFPAGGLYVFRKTEFSEETKIIIRRFAEVFNLTYTRFNDLKQAEQLALQAQSDLENLKTEKKKTEDALIELKAAQHQLIQSEKMASLGELTAGIAHEIQNPLNFVNNFSEVSNELLEEMNEEIEKGNMKEVKAIAADVKQNLEKINHHGKRADSIVKGMLQHSRSSSSQKELTDINTLTDEYIRLCYHGLRAKDNSFNATIKIDFDSTIGKINIIPQDIGRVILNLLTNAFYAVKPPNPQKEEHYQPTVSISTKKIGDKVEIGVTDNGNGIPKKVLDKIFQPFFTTKPTGQGTGLGLSLSYDIIKAHGGEITVETKEGDGTEFIIRLPIV